MSWSTLAPETRGALEEVLTPRELQVVKLRFTLDGYGEPLSWRKIGRQLDIDEATVRGHWARISRKAGRVGIPL